VFNKQDNSSKHPIYAFTNGSTMFPFCIIEFQNFLAQIENPIPTIFQILHTSLARNYRLREKICNIIIYDTTSNLIIYVPCQPTVNSNTISLSYVFLFFHLLSSFKLITEMHVWPANSFQTEQVT